MKYNIFDIANWFLLKESMPQKKLQKLCYYAKAWSLVLLKDIELDFPFQAWVHGPVNPELWNKYRMYGYCEIESNSLSKDAKPIDCKTEELLTLVWNTYGSFNGFQLEQLTHSEAPWIKAREGYGPLQPSSVPLNNQLIKDFYSKKYCGDGIGE